MISVLKRHLHIYCMIYDVLLCDERNQYSGTKLCISELINGRIRHRICFIVLDESQGR